MSAAQKLQKNVHVLKPQVSSVKSIHNDVINLVGMGEYTKAVQLLKDFSNNDFPYPNFKLKVERYVNHSIDLILAIEANRNFMGLGSLTRPKQHELKEKFKKHFEDLKSILRKIEVSYDELRAKDNKSTKYLVRAAWTAVVIVAANALFLDILAGLAETVYTLLETGINYTSDLVARLF